MTRLHALNRWYDTRREPFRFLLFATPCLISIHLMIQNDARHQLAGALIFATLAIVRIIPITFPVQRPACVPEQESHP